MALKLKRVLHELCVTQADLAEALEVSPATVAQICNHGKWPTSLGPERIKQFIIGFLDDAGCTLEQKHAVFAHEKSALAHIRGAETHTDEQINDEDRLMLLRKHTLTPDAKKAFQLFRDPFAEVRSADEVYLTPDSRYVRESLRAIAKHGGFAAIVGESGAGKSTLRRDLIEWAHAGHEPIVIIEPYVLGMEDNDKKGKTLKAGHIAEAILAAIAPRDTVRQSPDARFRQVHHALRESHRAGNRHVLVIEEAHSIPIPTLKHLKRFFELEDGFAKLLSIVLIGQPELAQKLDERNPTVREIVQRCELVTLRPLDAHLEGYLQHRFTLAGTELAKVMDAPAIEALRAKLTGRGAFSVLYPLAVHNVLTAALNEAASLGIPRLSADLIQGV
ncbi:transposase [Zobellella denitrificans]|uniref:Transposase n=1 Tax=Zobellella denitrificans TaxID=347534 RepID=A0A291HNF8_9GAMM|nr:AAA family ATPase [Zobellella denitrificans]ATG73652.1 transposase [Zobellella denitrificans]